MVNLYGGEAGLEEGSDVASPPLWKTSSQMKVSMMQSRLLNPHRHRVVSTTRSEEIAKDREKLMEMIQSLPGDLFELSLRDLVDKPAVQGVDQATVVDESKGKLDDHKIQKKLRSKIRNEQKKGLLRSGSMNGEHVVLKTFLPSFGIKKSSRPLPCLKVPRKHHRLEGDNNADSECWKKQATSRSLQLLPCLNVSPRYRWLKGKKDVESRCWKTPRFFVGKKDRNTSPRKMVKSSSFSGSSDRAATDLSPGCWLFFTKKRRALNRSDSVT